MSVAWDETAVITGQGAAVINEDTTIASGKTTTGANRCGILALLWYASITPTATYPTWGGSEMTECGAGADIEHDIGMRAKLYYIVNPPTASSNIVSRWPDNITSYIAIVSSFTGVDQGSPISAVAEAKADSTAQADPATVTCSTTAGELVVDAVSIYANFTAAPTNSAIQHELDFSAIQGAQYGGSSWMLGADGGVMSWTQGGNNIWAIAAASLRAAADDLFVDRWLSQERRGRGPRYSVVPSGMTPPSKIN